VVFDGIKNMTSGEGPAVACNRDVEVVLCRWHWWIVHGTCDIVASTYMRRHGNEDRLGDLQRHTIGLLGE